MRVVLAATLVLSCSINLFGQKKVLTRIDSNWTHSNDYINSYSDFEDYFSAGKGNEEINGRSADVELLEAAIYFTVNRYRKGKKREVLRYSQDLDGVASAYLNYSSDFKFRSGTKNRIRLNKFLRKVPRYAQFEFTFMTGEVFQPPSVDYTRGRYYGDPDLGLSDYNLYLGKRPKNDSIQKPKPINSITYDEFANRLVNQLIRTKNGREVMRSKAFGLIGIAVRRTKKRRYERGIPKVNLILLIGGYRNRLLYETSYPNTEN